MRWFICSLMLEIIKPPEGKAFVAFLFHLLLILTNVRIRILTTFRAKRKAGSMTDLRRMTAALTAQRQRLKELIEICGKLDPEHPLQAYSLRRIKWLEEQIETLKGNQKGIDT